MVACRNLLVGNGLWGQLMPKFILSDEHAQQSVPGRFSAVRCASCSRQPKPAGKGGAVERQTRSALTATFEGRQLAVLCRAWPILSRDWCRWAQTFRRQVAGRRFGKCMASPATRRNTRRPTGSRAQRFDAARLVGNVAAPSNVIAAARVADGGYTCRTGFAGAAAGAVGAALCAGKRRSGFLVQKLQEECRWRSCWRHTGAGRWR